MITCFKKIDIVLIRAYFARKFAIRTNEEIVEKVVKEFAK